jgi:hypothetical protein
LLEASGALKSDSIAAILAQELARINACLEFRSRANEGLPESRGEALSAHKKAEAQGDCSPWASEPTLD